MMNSILMGLDSLPCTLAVLAALDFLRSAHLFERPVLSLSFYLVALGALGLLAGLAKGYWVSPQAMVMHLGIVGYVWTCRRQIFHQDWRWDGAKRRRYWAIETVVSDPISSFLVSKGDMQCRSQLRATRFN